MAQFFERFLGNRMKNIKAWVTEALGDVFSVSCFGSAFLGS